MFKILDYYDHQMSQTMRFINFMSVLGLVWLVPLFFSKPPKSEIISAGLSIALLGIRALHLNRRSSASR